VSNACKIWIKKGRGEPWQEHDPNGELVALRAKVERLERENAALLRDKERLDWLLCEDTKEFVTPLGRGKRITDAYLRGPAESYRAAIDAARAKDTQP
jgi:hypothetical protein